MVMTIADMDLPIFHPIKKAILKQLEMTNNFTYKERSKQYFEAIINWYKERHNRSGNLELQP
jgi:bifunctional pyridoxal-dependent enzyme with beta-cystathionase and maltose regulon repressor activities